MTLEKFFTNHYSAQRILTPNGSEAYRYAILSWGRALGTTQLTQLSVMQFVAYYHHEIASGNSPHTIAGRRARISTLWRHAARAGLAPTYEPPPSLRPPPKIVTAIPPAVVADLVRHTLAMPRNVRGTTIPNSVYWPAFIAACYESALRRSDLMQLRWTPGGRWTLTQVKTRHPVTSQVSPSTLGLVAVLARVSPTLFDLGWSRCSYCHRLKTIGRQIGLHVTPQLLRESAASEAERLHPGSATQLLGHRSDATTRRWYIDYGYAVSEHDRPTIWGHKMAPSEPARRRQRGAG